MPESNENFSIADLLGPWTESNSKSELMDRCKNAWNKPLRDLSNLELATLLEQKIAVEHVLPIARKQVAEKVDDGSEFFEGQLQEAVDRAGKSV